MVDVNNVSELVEALNEQPIAEGSLAGYRGFLFFSGYAYLRPVRDPTLSRGEWYRPFSVENRAEWTVVRLPNNIYDIDNGNPFLSGYQGNAGMHTARLVVELGSKWEFQSRDSLPDRIRAILKQDERFPIPIEIILELNERWKRTPQISANQT